ncbi:MAG: RNA-2',3'-PO4:RNA-5'-OH ligase [uncultured Rubrobacteraceae bacterium]|uniref:3'-phosphate/5'-hydroxy nucleic acid ligase n=1 Tax=uncultured Rubrobacteraceae bacterium TaxID=349277 RepID=A0A6J4RJL8_9ACTN|nr:MAG: RNA-2',3'-PO4:RNA-5'-OH ligase [uncultured Rubrobacteraceae bacterium]
MVDQAEEFAWSGEGEEAEILARAPDEATATRAIDRALPAARLPGVQSPVHAAASGDEFGWVAASGTHAAPDLFSAPIRGLLLVADVDAGSLGLPARDLTDLARRGLAEAGPSLPVLNEAGVRRVCEEGAGAAAEDGLIEEEDLAHLEPVEGDPDALGRRALTAGTRDWEGGFGLEVAVVGEVLDSEGAESLGLRRGLLALVVRAGAGDLGRLALDTHRARIFTRIRAGVDFGAGDDLPAAPLEAEEAADLVAAARAASNFADARAARAVYALRRVLGEVVGGLEMRASWKVGGIEFRDGALIHRDNLAAVAETAVIVSGGAVAAGTGKMWRSAPPFGAPEDEGRWPWEEAGLLERWAELDPTRGEG